jgi:hypothetical protein
MRKLGYGQSTHSGFPGEAAGLLPPPDRWSGTSKQTMSYGYGLSVTPLQIAQAYAAIGNGGKLIAPTFVKGQRNEAHQVMDPVVANEVLRMMETVTLPGGTATQARVLGYRVAGKTGTARKASAGGYSAPLRRVLRGPGAGEQSAFLDGRGDQRSRTGTRVCRRPGVGAGVPQRHGRCAALDGCRAGRSRRMARGASRRGSQARTEDDAADRDARAHRAHRAGRVAGDARSAPMTRADAPCRIVAGCRARSRRPGITGLVMDSRAGEAGRCVRRDRRLRRAWFVVRRTGEGERRARGVCSNRPAPENAPAPADAIPVPGFARRDWANSPIASTISRRTR